MPYGLNQAKQTHFERTKIMTTQENQIFIITSLRAGAELPWAIEHKFELQLVYIADSALYGEDHEQSDLYEKMATGEIVEGEKYKNIRFGDFKSLEPIENKKRVSFGVPKYRYVYRAESFADLRQLFEEVGGNYYGTLMRDDLNNGYYYFEV